MCKVRCSLAAIQEVPPLGGWESALKNGTQESDMFHGVKLHGKAMRRKTHRLYVIDIRDFDAVRNKTLQSLKNYLNLDDRFNADITSTKRLSAHCVLVTFSETVSDTELSDCHEHLIPDLELASFALQYEDAASSKTVQTLSTTDGPSAV